MRAASAVAALVALAVVNNRSLGIWCEVRRLKLGIQTAPRASLAALPPSNNTSGFNGQCGSQVAEVVLKGLNPPAGAMGLITASIRLGNIDKICIGTHGQGIPCLSGIVNAVGAVTIGRVQPRHSDHEYCQRKLATSEGWRPLRPHPQPNDPLLPTTPRDGLDLGYPRRSPPCRTHAVDRDL